MIVNSSRIWTTTRRSAELAMVAVFLICPLVPSAASATIEKIQRRGVLEVCVNPDAMPFSSAFNGANGLQIDLANAVARELGVSATFSWVQFRFQAKYTRCDAYMGVGVLPGEDGGPVKKTHPFLKFETILVSRPGMKLTNLEALDGLKVGVQSGSLAHVTLLKRTVDTRVSFTREADMLAAILDGRLDAGFVSNVSLNWFLKNHPQAKLAEWPASIAQDPTGYPIAVGLRKTDEASVERINKIIAKLEETGELERIFSKYGLEKLILRN